MSDHRDYDDLAALYALDALEPAERMRFERHVASGCDDCERAVREATQVAEELLMATVPVAPPEATRRALMARVRRDGDADATQSSGPFSVGSASSVGVAMLAAAAALVAAVGLGVYAHALRGSLDEAMVARDAAERDLESLQDSLNAVTSPRNRAVSLDGLEAAASARALAYLDSENGRLFLYVENLPSLPANRTYQIWLLVDGVPVSVGTFDVLDDGSARLQGQPLPAFEGTVSVAVTEEPAGGVPQPTGPMVLLGS